MIVLCLCVVGSGLAIIERVTDLFPAKTKALIALGNRLQVTSCVMDMVVGRYLDAYVKTVVVFLFVIILTHGSG